MKTTPKDITVDELIAVLQKVKEERGGKTLVKAGSFCGTNQGFVHFDVKRLRANKRFRVANHLNGHGNFCLGIEISVSTRKDIEKGIEDMKRLGYRYYRSQFRKDGESPEVGLSVCEWHNPW